MSVDQAAPPDDGAVLAMAAPDAPAAAPSGPSASQRGRRIVIAGFVSLVVAATLVVFLLPLSAEQRQQHRRDTYAEPAPRFLAGEAAFLLQIPAIGLDQVVVRGSEPARLRGGPGWREGTASPGQGNTVVLAHSTLWGSPFGGLRDLPAGTTISVRTRDGRIYGYRVTRVRTVPGDRTAVMRQAGPSRLTLVTSAGGPVDQSRVVVFAESAGSRPAVPRAYRADLQRGNPGPFDDRPPGDLVMFVAGFFVAGFGIWGAAAFRGRRSPGAIALVAGPAIALGVVLVLFHLDSVLPTTF